MQNLIIDVAQRLKIDIKNGINPEQLLAALDDQIVKNPPN